MRFEDVPREVLAAVAALAVLYALVVFVRGWVKRARMRHRFERAAEGEREAAFLLQEHGFEIEGAQVAATYELNVDGSPVAIRVCADYIVSRGGSRFVAEVKTGNVAPKVETAATRRQLLEYFHVFDVAGVLLVDADARTVRHVMFASERRRKSFLPAALVVVAIVVVVIARLVP